MIFVKLSILVKNNLKQLVITFLLLSFLVQKPLNAQFQESTFGFHNNSLNTVRMPGYLLDYRFVIGAPVIGNLNIGLSSQNISLGNIFGLNGANSLNMAKNIKTLYDNLEETQFVRTNVQYDLLYVGFRTKDDAFYYSGFSIENTANIDIPKDFLSLVIDGNAIKKNEDYNSINLSGLNADVNLFGKIYFGAAKSFQTRSGRYSVGAKVNVISNGYSMRYRANNYSILTAYSENSAGIDIIVNGEGQLILTGENEEDSKGNVQVTTPSIAENVTQAFSFNELGFSLDLGMLYENYDYTVYFGFDNLIGFINNINNTYKNDFKFEDAIIDPVSLNEISAVASTNKSINIYNRHLNNFKEGIVLPFQNFYSFDSLSKADYVISLPTRFKFGYIQEINDFSRYGVQYNHTFYQDRGYFDATAFYMLDFDYRFQTKFSYTYTTAAHNLGLFFFGNVGAFQLYGGTSNIYQAIKLSSLKETTFQFGMSIVIDRLFLFKDEILPDIRDFSRGY